MFLNWWVINPRCSPGLLKTPTEFLLWIRLQYASMEALALRSKVHLACRPFVVLKGGSRFFRCMDSIPESGQ